VKIDGILFKPHCAVIIDIQNEEPIFVEIFNIYSTSSSVVFHIKQRTVRCHSHHFHSYVVDTPSIDYLINHENLKDEHPHGIYTSPDPIASISSNYIISRNVLV
jgi:hypothetical protein